MPKYDTIGEQWYPTWVERTSAMTPGQKVLAAFEWAAGMAHQGENAGSEWDFAMQETLPILRQMVEGKEDA